MPGELHSFVVDDSFTMGNKIIIKTNPDKENTSDSFAKKPLMD